MEDIPTPASMFGKWYSMGRFVLNIPYAILDSVITCSDFFFAGLHLGQY